ncbi:type IV pili methyl-accepting chemotaxis transducer N-terminal domain-containing protein [Plasticicumulans sp.]|uniref:type IV pili methyl-accepting chemotaxis transducer N-terminal domain-containing protein n=1 Tax=Plasticicumulans sp. TaxID=2307179 RepID=UPI002B52148D|nr:type IV pili methyl-accepting chemotaxis transducer N-terminal domain-containing protein [Plasticicumulans sp.]HMV37736.1 type IV pili methyl-accepting chemotaxis transducer N-terminal domain-containing protein [Plasticicumulans sp.]HMW29819.1 type IV pili methyl-accepting chemotaxis transducer N-terminal domain-containing protein [Plasticicumulans sp.]HMW42746.1 type IV pili methyl-accepting chemotaxis transducer N-terminal domain-containing protein [Plasticicumulans sp.]HMX52345.1 type IV 
MDTMRIAPLHAAPPARKSAGPGAVLLLSLMLAPLPAAFVLPPPAVAAESLALSTAINMAGRQRMLTQRMTMAYAQIGLDVQTDEARQRLEAAVQQFESQLATLQVSATTPEVKTALVQVDALWRPFRVIVTAAPTQAGARELIVQNEALLAAAQDVVLRLQAQSQTPAAHLVDLAGRQRMLSQRIGKFYMLSAWGLASPELSAEMQKAGEQFRSALDELRKAPQNTPEISADLQEVDRLWVVYERAFRLRDGQQYIPTLVAVTSEKILQQMDRITGLYEKLMAAK